MHKELIKLLRSNVASRELDIDGNKVSETNYPSQWAISYAIAKTGDQFNTTTLLTFSEYVFEGVLVQFLDKSIQKGEIIVTWDEENEQFKYASSLKLQRTKDYSFISLEEILSKIAHNWTYK